MKHAARLFGVVAVAVSISVLVLPALADNAHGRGTGRFGSGGPGRNFRGGGFGGGYFGGYHGGFRNRYWGWGGWYPWNFSFAYDYSSPPYYYYDGYYYPPTAYYPPPVVYGSGSAAVYDSPPAAYNSGSPEVDDSSPPAPTTESSQRPVVDRPLSPTAVDRDSPPVSPRREQRPPSIQRSDQGQSLGVADVKALVKAGLSDEVILSHIRSSHAAYRLSTAEIIDLKESGVSEKIIDFMINTAL